ncbi:LIVCS family branched-chain amino acid:cation transporter [Lactobacillus colini]|uniref:Branched-chain amino acid transport system carrier protein n=1 Tax=Lactobacillus colini TaxID=1819254 RepID=A0ABS4MGV8_9LACO|nr:branched-chain amino acid transport system II carrier protein [Lactobacillus colini]MBP2058932.1 LIVCS family branched-chain amino acid:cation transporter [Lactobacillus colini]
MKESPNKRFSIKQYLIVASMIFALFFGAGNLIFPLYLGQLAGKNWLLAAIGFLTTGVALPLLALLAIAVTRSNGMYDLALPLGKKFALIFMTLIHLTIGPFFATPRTATVSYTVGVAPLLPREYRNLGLIIFTVVFFILVYVLAFNQNDILSSLGKILNPIFLVALFLVFVIAFVRPMGNPNLMPVANNYTSGALMNGFLEGYNTMDALAGLAFGIAVVSAIRSMGIKQENEIAKVTAKSGIIGIAAIGVIYLLLIIMGAMSLGKFSPSTDGGTAFSQIVRYYAGTFGQAFLAFLIVLTCFTTAVGLVAAFAEDFHQHFPIFSYHVWLTIASVVACLVGTCGLDQIIKWSKPMLMFLYPLVIVLIVLSLLSPYIKKDPLVYQVTISLTLIPSIFDLVNSLPAPLNQTAFVIKMDLVRSQFLPLAGLGLSWVVPALLGLGIGIILHILQKKNKLL